MVARGPELPLRHVVDGEEGELVRLAEHGRLALPGTARLGVQLDPARMREVAHRAVEVLAEHVVARAAVGAHERLGGGWVTLHEAREERQVGAYVAPGVLLELVLEVARPRGHRPLPAHAVEVREGLAAADESGDLLVELALEAHVVAGDGLRVEHVHVVLVPGQHGVAEAHGHALRAGRAGRHARAHAAVAAVVEALAARRAHRVDAVAAVLPAARLHLGAGVPHLLHVDVVVVRQVGDGHLRGLGGGAVHVDEALRRVLAHLPRTVQLAARGAHVHRELQAEARRLADGELDELLPFGRHEGDFGLRVHDVALVVPVAARVEHEQSAEAEALHRLQVGRDRLLVRMAVDPPPVAPGPVGGGRTGEALFERNGERAEHAQQRGGEQSGYGFSHSPAILPKTRPPDNPRPRANVFGQRMGSLRR